MTKFQAIRIGVLGREALQEGQSGGVMGVTSTGAFLRVVDKIVFLTTLPYLSPYNLQVIGAEKLIQKLQPGEAFRIEAGKVIFLADESEVIFQAAEVWEPGEPVGLHNPVQAQLAAVNQIFEQIRTLEGDKGFLFLVTSAKFPPGSHQESIHLAAQNFKNAFHQKNLARVITATHTLLGSGSGLTPSGDDLLTGFFLYHIRSAQSQGLYPDFSLLALDEVIRHARQKTTTISVNRLEAARYGWAEELFLSLLDHLFSPDLSTLPDALAQKLLNFGHSSGVDTLVGIYYALLSLGKK